MKKYTILFCVLALMYGRWAANKAAHGIHSQEFFSKLADCKDAGFFLIIGILLLLLKRKSTKVVAIVGAVFCFTTTLFLLNDFLPFSIASFLRHHAYFYFGLWCFVGVVLLISTMFNPKLKTA